MLRMKIGDRVNYKNYWDGNDKGTAVVVEIEDTVFNPFEETDDDDLVYSIEDEETGRVFEIDDTDYYVELI